MARCSRCKNPSWPLHKRRGAVFCEHCMAVLEYGGMRTIGFEFKSLWFDMTGWVGRTLRKIWEWGGFNRKPKIEIDVEHVKYSAARAYGAKPKAARIVRIGGGYQKTA